MAKKYSIKFWISFWLISAVFLTGWFFFWEFKSQGIKTFEKAVSLLPGDAKTREELKAAYFFAEYLLREDNAEKVFLVLFQNNLELRPGGGYIGTFGILKIKNGTVVDFQTHDLSNFDARIPDGFEPPYPMKQTLSIKNWKMRDSNYSPDFLENAKKAEEFYYLGQGEEQFDGVVAITANVLTSILEVTGPVEIEGYPGKYEDQNAILSLEYQVEKGYVEQGIDKGSRKNIMNDLADAIIEKLKNSNNSQKIKLLKNISRSLDSKDIQLYFKDPELQMKAEEVNWAGLVDERWSEDFLMLVDANLGSYKSDYYMERDVEYFVDLSKDKPEVKLKVTYNHTAKQKDWMTNDYTTYLRIYVPEGSWLSEYPNESDPQFGRKFNKKYFGFLLRIPIGESKTFEFTYTLPGEVRDDYKLKIQKQAGLTGVNYDVHVITQDSMDKKYVFRLESDRIINIKESEL